MSQFPYLSVLTFLPLIAALALIFVPAEKKNAIRYTALGVVVIQILITVVMWMNFNFSLAGINDINGYQFIDKFDWIVLTGIPLIGTFKIEYFLGLDGLSMPMVILSSIIAFIAVISSWNIEDSTHKPNSSKGYFILLMILNTGTLGVFLALDFFMFYIFWELVLLPMYFLIGIWGGPRREYAAIKFFIYTLAGSVLILLAIIGLYLSAYESPEFKVHTFNMLNMMNAANFKPDSIMSVLNPENFRFLAFLGLFIGFAIKIPLFPFHTWLPDAHVEAPTPISVVLAGVLLKMGGYAILRVIYPIFPEQIQEWMWWIACLGMINIVYGAYCALGQKDFKKLIAYSSVSHMGFVVLGIAALAKGGGTLGLTGGVLQMFNHGTVTAMLFLIVGVIYERTHKRGLDDFGGLSVQMPMYTGVVTLAFFAAFGLPGLSSFVSELMIFIGAFSTESIRTLTIISAIGIVMGAVYMLRALQKIFLGKPREEYNDLKDLTVREYIMFVPLAIIVIIFGIYPTPMLEIMNSSMTTLLDAVMK
ncbi:NADH-quinone oxidoreductase subunit M [Ignavibacteriales bacterium]